VLRETHSAEYVTPIGVWQTREGIHQALLNRTNIKKEFDSPERAYCYARSSLSVSQIEWIKMVKYIEILKGSNKDNRISSKYNVTWVRLKTK
jgi:hypothetical protein